MFDKKLVVIGAGGHAKVAIDVARAAGWLPVVALDPVGPGRFCADVPVIGSDSEATSVFANGVRFALLALGSNRLRLRIGEQLEQIGFVCPPILHPQAVVSSYAKIDNGTIVMPHATINSHARIGRFAIVNTGAIIEHDCPVADGAHIAPRSVLGGTVSIGREVLFGIGSVARPGSSVGDGATVGAGSVIIEPVDANEMVVGAPARPIGTARA